MSPFNWFVLPFTLGLVFLLLFLAVKYSSWILRLPDAEKTKVKKGILTWKTLDAMREVFMESLLHRKIFKVNPRLGYMHASLAFGWFLLIVVGNVESRIFYDGHVSPPYVPIFFRFFNPNPENFEYERTFAFIMDLILLVVLSGVGLAWFKRMHSRFFGMKKTTVLRTGDRFALASLWFIFPLRFLAESFTSAKFGGGHFLTATAGSFFGSFLPAGQLAYPAWWAYSTALGIFFVSLPFSRYMHIPTEVVLIFLRKYRVQEKTEFTPYTSVEVNSCSRCGICLDPCQMASAANIKNTQSVYFLQSVRNENICEEKSLNCLMCGRCDNICPVGIDIASIRTSGRKSQAIQKEEVYKYIPESKAEKADVIYFAGCMTHLQPSVKKSMTELMKAAGVNYLFMDEDGSICCGRPLMLAGKTTQAQELMRKNKSIIESSGAKTLVTSCPICYKVFKEEYHLPVEVLHHSEYLLKLAEEKKLKIHKQNLSAVYHDPCELGRKSGIYDQPRKLLNTAIHLEATNNEKEDALCCGGSLANIKISPEDRRKISVSAVESLTSSDPDIMVTGCPMCKSTFQRVAPVQVLDIAEIIAKSITRKESAKSNTKRLVEEVVESGN